MTVSFAATQRRADGKPVLEIGTPYKFTHAKAAKALAIVYGGQPMRTGVNKLVDGLHLAIQDKVFHRGLVPAPAAVDRYLAELRDNDMFPTPERREQMLEELRRTQAEWRAMDPATRPTRAIVPRHPRTWARHVIEEADVDGVLVEESEIGEPAARIEEPAWYLLDEAATALALVHEDVAPTPRSSKTKVPRWGKLLRDMLKVAGAKGVLSSGDKPDPKLVKEYRKVLIEQGVFPVG